MESKHQHGAETETSASEMSPGRDGKHNSTKMDMKNMYVNLAIMAVLSFISEIKELCRGVLSRQQSEIDWMKRKLAELDSK